MKKLGLLLIACFAFAAISVAQNNIVKSLERKLRHQLCNAFAVASEHFKKEALKARSS